MAAPIATVIQSMHVPNARMSAGGSREMMLMVDPIDRLGGTFPWTTVGAARWSDADRGVGVSASIGPPDQAPGAYLAGNALRAASASARIASTSAPYFALAWA